mmetsp:Transcript_74046/g.197396  ORF Transcript_74046/g.197396 Transcript_74046/m.197396 type:complete len:447 (-) Transcript_74046:170-1510(-)
MLNKMLSKMLTKMLTKMSANEEGPKPGLAMYARLATAFVGVVLLYTGVGLQLFSAGNLYNVPLSMYCQAYSGSGDLATAQSFKTLISTAYDSRKACLALNGTDRDKCCASIGGYSGLCARPDVPAADYRSNGTFASARDKLNLTTSILGSLFGVNTSASYNGANAEFWCKNCPNDYRKNCPFNSADSGTGSITDSKVCNCPGGTISSSGQAFWATIGEASLASDYILCSDKAQVYKAYINSLFPEFTSSIVDDATNNFYSRCLQGRSSTGYILAVGPGLAIVAGVLLILSLHKKFANSVVPVAGFEIAMLSIALELVSFWPLSFTGAASLISRYSFCAGYSYPVVLNASVSNTASTRAAPTFFNGSPCYDLNSEGQSSPNPFVQQLGVFNAGYVSGGVLIIVSLLVLLAVVSKHADVIFEMKLAGKITLNGGGGGGGSNGGSNGKP